jgi:hypothetical protein
MTILSKFGSNWATGSRQEDFYVNFLKLKIEKRGKEFLKNLLLWNYWANLNQTLLKWSLGGPLPKLCPAFHSTKVWLQLAKWFLRRRFLCEFPIGSYVKLSSAVGAILVGVLKCRTHIWKGTTQESFQQSLVEIFDKRSHLNLLLWNRWTKLNQTWQGWFLGGSLSKLCPSALSCIPSWLEVGITGHNLEGGHPRTIPPKFGCNWPSGFWGED